MALPSWRQAALRAAPRCWRARLTVGAVANEQGGAAGSMERSRGAACADERAARAGLPAEARAAKRVSREGGSNSVVESQPSKLLVAGSIPVSRSILRSRERARASDGKPAECAGVRRQESGRAVASRLVGRSVHDARDAKADVAQLAERVLGKDEVTGSIPVIGSNFDSAGLRSRATAGEPASMAEQADD